MATVNAESRYGNAGPTKLKGVGDIQPDDIPSMMNDLRSVFNTDRTCTKAWRISQLEAFLRMIDEEGPALCAAMQKDLHKYLLIFIHTLC